MIQIVAPMQLNDRGKKVQNLHFTLFLCLQKSNDPKLTSLLKAQQFTQNFKNEALDQLYGRMTSGLVKSFQERPPIPVGDHPLTESGNIDEPTAEMFNKLLPQYGGLDMNVPPGYPFDIADPEPEKLYKVSGRVMNKFNQPIPNQQLIAFDIDLKGARHYRAAKSIAELQVDADQQALDTGFSDSNGNYELSFVQSSFEAFEFSPADKADVIVFAIQSPFTHPELILKNGATIVGRSALSVKRNYSGNQLLNWDVLIEDETIKGQTEFSRVMEIITPLLQSTPLFTLKDSPDQINFVATETGQDLPIITLLVQAHALLMDVFELFNPQLDSAIKVQSPLELLYGIGRQSILLSLSGLAVTRHSKLLKALEASMKANIISTYPVEVIAEFLAALEALSHKLITTPDPNGKDNEVTKMLGFALGRDADLQTKYLASVQNHTGSPKDFWGKVLPQKGFKAAAIKAIQLTNQIKLLTNNHIPLIEELQVNQKISKAEDLLKLSDADWKAILDKTGIPGKADSATEQEKNSYSANVQGLLNSSFPNQKIAMMLTSKALHIKDENLNAGLIGFLSERRDFNMANDSPHDAGVKEALDAIHPKALENIKHLQRILQVSPTPKAMSVLYKENALTSSRDIAQIPPGTFIAAYADRLGGKDIAAAVHDRARYLTKRVDQVFMTVYDSLHGITPAFSIAGGTKELLSADESAGAVLSAVQHYFPNWENLFGVTNIGECKDCQSITSPAAYLVNLLQFLSDSKTGDVTALDVLFARRPDLGDLPLTCENTNTIIPYIDLVNEIMEYYTVNGGAADKPYKGYDTGDTTTEELHANPQNTSKEAYRILSNSSSDSSKKSVYPFTLPYNQPLDRIRVYLEKLQTSRAEIMEIFRKDTGEKDQTTTNAINAEKLRISAQEYQILVGKTFDGSIDKTEVFQYYGYPDEATMLTQVTNVQVFIRKAGIDYTDLVEIIKTRFVNAAQPAFAYIRDLFLSQKIAASDFYDKLFRISSGEDLSTELNSLLTGKISYEELKKKVTGNFPRIQQIITLYESTEDIRKSGFDISKTYFRTIESLYKDSVQHNGITAGILTKLHRFIRLWKKLGWSIHDLDAVITSLGGNDITDTLINNIAVLQKIKTTLSLSSQQIGSLWGTIDSYGKNSLYNKLFLNKAAKEIDPVFQPNPLGLYFAGDNARPLKDHIPAIQAALKLSADEISLILDDYPFKNIPVLSLENLSAIYRYVLLAGALRLSVSELITLKSLSGINPFPEWDAVSNTFIDIDPKRTLEFIGIAGKINNSGFKIDVLNYIVTGSDESGRIQLQPERILQAIVEISGVVAKIDQDNPDADITIADEDLLSKRLQLIFPQELANAFFDLINNKRYDVKAPAGLLLSKLPPGILYDTTTGVLQCYGILGDDLKQSLINIKVDKDEQVAQLFKDAINELYKKPDEGITGFIKKNFAGFISEDKIEAVISDIKIKQSIQQASVNNLYIEMYRLFLPFLKGLLSKNIVIQFIASLIGLNEADVSLLLKKQVDEFILLISKKEQKIEITDPEIKDLAGKISIAYRAALFINGFALTSIEFEYFNSNGKRFGDLDFLNLSFVQWQRIADYTLLRKETGSAPGALIKIFKAASVAGATIQNLIDARLIDGKVLPQLINWFGISKVEDFQDEVALTRLDKALSILQRTGAPLDKFAPVAEVPAPPATTSWAGITTNFNSLWDIAEDIKNTLKAGYAEADWLLLSKAMGNQVRENQKLALVAYLLVQPELQQWGVYDADGLFEYFLIDVQMDACMDTSRMVQALSSIQLFVHRILLNLESNRIGKNGNSFGISPGAIDSDEWAWRKYYRVWQAAREIYLFPENWLEPEWRDDKSPFFKELEAELLQNDITADSVETAFRNYLTKLEEVSNLDVCGMHQVDPSNPGSDIYVFARTHHTPYYYYWRKKTGGEWTAWEKIPVDIRGVDDTIKPGVHLMPVFWKNRLILFWPEFAQKIDQSAAASSDEKISGSFDKNSFNDLAAEKHWEIRLAWSEYKDKKWQPKVIANEPLIPGYIYQEQDGHEDFFKALYSAAYTNLSLVVKDKLQFNFLGYTNNYLNSPDDNSPIGTTVLNSLQSKLLHTVPYRDQSDRNPGTLGGFYTSNYQKWHRNGTLRLFDNDYLTSPCEHSILFSNQVTDFGTNVDLKYPFFFQDAQHVYFVMPASLISYRQWIADPDSIPPDKIMVAKTFLHNN